MPLFHRLLENVQYIHVFVTGKSFFRRGRFLVVTTKITISITNLTSRDIIILYLNRRLNYSFMNKIQKEKNWRTRRHSQKEGKTDIVTRKIRIYIEFD